jgi:hypothetical protein
MHSSLLRVFTCLVLVTPSTLGCTATHVVGSDDGGEMSDDGGGKSEDGGGGGMDDGGGKTHAIACGSATCDGTTEYCLYTPGCIEKPDGATNRSFVCTPIPSACVESTNTCQCILESINKEFGSSGDTVDPDAGADCTVTNNCA